MSGVAKDETTPVSVPDGIETPALGAVSEPDGQGEPAESAAVDAEIRSARKAAPHLRVVSSSDEDAPAPATSADIVEADAAATELSPAASPSEAEKPAERVGPYLRSVRESMGYDLETVARSTRIHITHLRAIEDMRPKDLGAPVYAKGYIRSYAQYLKLQPDAILARYMQECGLLGDPAKPDILPEKSPEAVAAAHPLRPYLIPAVGAAAVLLVGAAAAAVYFAMRQPESPSADAAGGANRAGGNHAVTGPNVGGPTLRIVALRRAWIEVRAFDGTKYRSRYFSPGESYAPRVGAGWTVTAKDGAAFEWRLGDVSLGKLSPDGGPVYAQSVDSALSREPVLGPQDPALAPAPAAAPAAAATAATAPAAPPATPAASAARPVKPAKPAPAATSTSPPPVPATDMHALEPAPGPDGPR